MRSDDGKSTWQDTTSRYGPGMALFAMGIACKCAWDHHVAHRILLPPTFPSGGAADLKSILASEERDLTPPRGLASGKDSLEDALKSLEFGNRADDAALEETIAKQRKASTSKSAKGAKATKSSKKQQKVSGKPAEKSAETPQKQKKSTSKATKKASTTASAAEDALSKLEGKKSKAASAASAGEPELSEADIMARLKEILGGGDDEDPRPPLMSAKKSANQEAKDERAEVPEEPVDEGFHVEFQRRLQEERDREDLFNISDIKKEFKSTYDTHHKKLLCSGCKLVTARLGAELDNHDVRTQENPAEMLTSVRKAIESTCSSLRHLDVVPHESGYKFEAGEAAEEAAELRVGQKLCHSLLEETRFDMLTTLMRKKVATWQVPKSEENWERRICATKAKFCKRSDTQEDGDDDSDL